MEKTCRTCRHWQCWHDGQARLETLYSYECAHIIDMLSFDIDIQGDACASVTGVETKGSFGCNGWEEFKPEG